MESEGVSSDAEASSILKQISSNCKIDCWGGETGTSPLQVRLTLHCRLLLPPFIRVGDALRATGSTFKTKVGYSRGGEETSSIDSPSSHRSNSRLDDVVKEVVRWQCSHFGLTSRLAS